MTARITVCQPTRRSRAAAATVSPACTRRIAARRTRAVSTAHGRICSEVLPGALRTGWLRAAPQPLEPDHHRPPSRRQIPHRDRPPPVQLATTPGSPSPPAASQSATRPRRPPPLRTARPNPASRAAPRSPGHYRLLPPEVPSIRLAWQLRIGRPPAPLQPTPPPPSPAPLQPQTDPRVVTPTHT